MSNYNKGKQHQRAKGNNRDGTRPTKAIWKESPRESFVNPYNFISLKSECDKRAFNIRELEKSSNLLEGNLTGWIEYELETKTPLFIPNTSNENAFNLTFFDKEDKQKKSGKSYDFFSYNDIAEELDRKGKYSLPVIPGSEIRGVIRSAFETVTNSCMSTIDEGQLLHKRIASSKKPGILKKKNGKWVVQQADKVMLKVKPCKYDPVQQFNIDKFREGQEVYIAMSKNKYRGKGFMPYTVAKLEEQSFPGSTKGYLHKGEPFTRKHHESVFIPLENEVEISEEAVKRLKQVLELYRESNKDRYKEFAVNENRTLVYSDDEHQYLSPACITKEVFEKKLKEILIEQGNYGPCDPKKNICPACKLFGTVASGEALASRVRFEDARPVPVSNIEDYYLDEIILAELASPQISATEFYLERPEKPERGALWNYDYAIDQRGKKIKDYQPKIRGRKYYWHTDPIKGRSYFKLNKDNLKDSNKYNERNAVIRPVVPRIEFKGRVFFDRVREKELLQLIWALNIGDNDNGNSHKIGKGKPLGFGSIKIRVTAVNYRKIKLEQGLIEYWIESKSIEEMKINEANIVDKNCQSMVEFSKITDFNSRPPNVCYPLGEEKKPDEVDTATYLWFVGNKLIDPQNPEKNHPVNRMNIYKELPKINVDNKGNQLPKYIKK